MVCAALSWVVPAGEYQREIININGVERTVIVDGSFHTTEQSQQSWQVFSALALGFTQQAGIIIFLLIIGGAFQVVNSSGAVNKGISAFISKVKQLEKHKMMRKCGAESIIVSMIIVLFSSFGAIFGMSEETLPFVAIMVPLAISMGYDSITGLCMVYVAAHIGFSGAILNPFTIGIAQGLSNLPLFSGLGYRMICWTVLTTLFIVIVLCYASKVKKNPCLSSMYAADNWWRKKNTETTSEEVIVTTNKSSWSIFAVIILSLIGFTIYHHELTPWTLAFVVTGWLTLRKSRQWFILDMLAFTVAFLVLGVMDYGWYMTEISSLFLALGIASGFACGMDTDKLISEFMIGAKDMLMAAIVVGMAGGVITILQDGHIIDTILHSLASLMSGTGRILSLMAMYIIQTFINIIIPSGSAKAAITMPIMAPFSDVIGISRQATVLAFQFGDGFTNMITPTSGVLMGAIGLARIPYSIWVKWFFRILVFFIFIGAVLLLPTVMMKIPGF